MLFALFFSQTFASLKKQTKQKIWPNVSMYICDLKCNVRRFQDWIVEISRVAGCSSPPVSSMS